MSDPNPNLKLMTVFESANPVSLDLAQAALEDAGIDYVLSPPATPEFGFTPILNPVAKILVAESAVTKALEALENLPEPGTAESGEEQPADD